MTRVISIILLVLSLALAGYLVYSVRDTIESREMISQREDAIIERLELIREAQIVYQEVHGHYTSDWDSLVNFIKTGQFPILQRSETIITLAYGADSVIVNIDTLGYISARERIFEEKFTVDAADQGVFRGFFVEEGDKVEQNQQAYRLETNTGVYTHKFKNAGTVSELADVQPGDSVSQAATLIEFWAYRFNPNVNVDRLAYVPGYDDDTKFEMYADEVTKGNVIVDVIEVKNPKPFDPARSESNEARNRKPLRFGSRTDVTTAGNWE